MAPIQIEMISVAAPYHVAQIKTSKFPLGGALPRIHVFLSALLQTVATGLSTDTFLDLEYLANGREAFNAHTSEWRPQIGLGVWPDRAPPELWKISDLFRMAMGEKIPLMYQVARVTGGPKASTQAFDLLLGSGMVITIVHNGSTEQMLDGYKQTFLPKIQQPNLRIQPFFMPLLDLKSVQNRRAGELESWLGGARFYLRESPAENAVLLVTDADLESMLLRAGAKGHGGEWVFE